ncbi:MAG: hypothetical protein ACXWUH_09760 [Burkholderiales bacterium]
MFRVVWMLILGLALAACAQLPPSPQEIEAKRFESVPGKAVIYVVRDEPDFTDDGATLMLDDQMMGTTYPGTFFRWVVAPGRHQIRGFAGDAGSYSLDVGPDRVYFIQQWVTRFFPFSQSHFQLVPEPHGRAAVLRSVLVGGQ